MKIPYTKAKVTESDVLAVKKSTETGWGEKCYDDLLDFERNFAKFVGVDFAIATSSATGALHIGLHALGVGAGDEVILADINWIATVAPVVHVGATPVFVDIDPVSWCIDPAKVELSISPRTKAVIATHLYGNLCEIERLKNICDKHGLFLIEDAAEAIGSYFSHKHVGCFGVFGYFSFHGTKTITSGEGGALVTNSADFHRRIKELNNHGRHLDEQRQFYANEIGFKFRMSNLQAALVNSQLSRVGEIVDEKRSILNYYRERLSVNKHLSMNPEQKNCSSGAWMPTVVFDERCGINRQEIVSHLNSNGIDARTFFWPLSQLPPFENTIDTPISYSVSNRAINLPSYLDITEKEMDHVIDAVTKLT